MSRECKHFMNLCLTQCLIYFLFYMWIWLCGIDIIDNKKRPTFKTQRERMQNEEEEKKFHNYLNNIIKINVLWIEK